MEGYLVVFLIGLSVCYAQFAQNPAAPTTVQTGFGVTDPTCAHVQCQAITTCLNGNPPILLPGDCCETCPTDSKFL